jgi:hypothetical protein
LYRKLPVGSAANRQKLRRLSRPADWQSAIQPTGNLRYKNGVQMRADPCHPRNQRFIG